jgi:K+-transporting ATPase ATPase C chain
MKDAKTALLMLIAFTVICGGIYPAIVTGIAQAVFPKKANGSFITDKNGQIVGSTLIGQPFSAPKYFWPRPSSTGDFGYNPAASGGSNLGPTNPAYIDQVEERVKALRNSGITGNIPSEMVQASGSGLDPHISPKAARVQIPRVARARGISPAALQKLVDAHVEDRQLGVFGNRRVNVLALNLALDKLAP